MGWSCERGVSELVKKELPFKSQDASVTYLGALKSSRWVIKDGQMKMTFSRSQAGLVRAWTIGLVFWLPDAHRTLALQVQKADVSFESVWVLIEFSPLLMSHCGPHFPCQLLPGLFYSLHPCPLYSQGALNTELPQWLFSHLSAKGLDDSPLFKAVAHQREAQQLLLRV